MASIGIWGATAGGGSGIGRKVLELLVGQSYKVFLFGRSQSKVTQVASEEPGLSGSLACDLLSSEGMALYQSYLISNKISTIVCCVGRGFEGTIATLSLADFRSMTESNLLAPFVVLKSAVRPFQRFGSGRLIMFGSIVSYRPLQGFSGYTATKMGLRGLVEAARQEMRQTLRNLSIHGVYTQSVQAIGFESILQSVQYLLRLPFGVNVDLILDGGTSTHGV